MSRFRPARHGGGPTIFAGRLTPAMLWVLLGSIGLTVAYAFAGGPAVIGENVLLGAATVRAGRLWTIATALALHVDPGALLSVGISLWLFGSPLERLWGTRATLRFLLWTGLAGNALAALAALAGAPGVSAGLSGPGLALIVAWGVHYGEARAMIPGGAVVRCRHLAMFMIGMVAIADLMDGVGVSTAALIGAGLTGYWLAGGGGDGLDRLLRRLRPRRRDRLRAVPGGRDQKWVN